MAGQPRAYRWFDLIMASFVAVLITSNIASSAKVIAWPSLIPGIILSFDAGTLLFPISYIFGDILTEVYGYRRSRRVIWTGFAALGLSAAFFGLVRLLPGDQSWQGYAGQDAYNAILGGISSGGIFLASLTAFLVGEFSNSYILAKLKILTQGKMLWLRTIGSTLVGEAVDSFLFTAIACLTGVFPWQLFWTISTANYIFKTLIEALMTPLTYKVVNWLKNAEGEDYYDHNTDFNPFVRT